jgi:hypothetical protein
MAVIFGGWDNSFGRKQVRNACIDFPIIWTIRPSATQA